MRMRDRFRMGAVAAAVALALAACASRPDVDPSPRFAAALAGASPAVVGIADSPNDAAGGAALPDRPVIGSGFRIAGTNLIATAAHVVAGLRGAPVVVWQSRRWTARLLRSDVGTDVALLEVDPSAPMPGLALAEGDAGAPGTWVLVIGCPFGALPTATTGIVSARPGAVLRPESLRSQMQLNAAVNPGNSGGPVVTLDAKVIGIANATVPAGFGLGFAVPVSALRRLLDLSRTGPGN